jgi:hypothetical protein
VSVTLRFKTRAPASTVSVTAMDSSSGVALGTRRLLRGASEKIGRTKSVQSGAIDGALLPRVALRIPATNVPCMQAALSALVHAPDTLALTSRIFLALSSGCGMVTGPSINPIKTSGRPLVRSMTGVRFTNSKAGSEFVKLANVGSLYRAEANFSC